MRRACSPPPLHEVGRPVDLGDRLPEWLSLLARHGEGEILLAVAKDGCRPVQDPSAIPRRDGAPFGQAPEGRVHGVVKIVLGGMGDPAEDFSRRGVEDVFPDARRTGPLLTVDQKIEVSHAIFAFQSRLVATPVEPPAVPDLPPGSSRSGSRILARCPS